MRNTTATLGSIVVNLQNITACDGAILALDATMTVAFPDPADAHKFVTNTLARITAATLTIRKVTAVTTALRFARGRLVRHYIAVGDTLTVTQLADLAR